MSKRPFDYKSRPDGALTWLALLATPIILELIAVATGNSRWTVSHAVSWALGPAGTMRWWMLGMPFLALCLWVGPHWLWPDTIGGQVLLAMLAVAVALGIIGALTT